MRNYLILSIPVIVAAFAASLARADSTSSGFGSLINAFFGSPSEQSSLSSCSNPDGAQSLVGGVNGIFCHLEKDMGISGVTSTAGVTKSFTFSSGTKLYVHAVVSGAVGGGAYSGNDFQAQIWGCVASTTTACSSASQFSRFIYLTWSFKSDKTINKGSLWEDPGSLQGSPGSAISVTYDVGSSTTSKSITATAVVTGFEMIANATHTGTVYTFGLEEVSGSGSTASTFDVAAAVDSSSGNTLIAYNVAANATPASSVPTLTGSACYARTQGASDYAYTAASSGGACSSLPSIAYPTTTPSALSGTTAASLAPATSTMSTVPGSI